MFALDIINITYKNIYLPYRGFKESYKHTLFLIVYGFKYVILSSYCYNNISFIENWNNYYSLSYYYYY